MISIKPVQAVWGQVEEKALEIWFEEGEETNQFLDVEDGVFW